jgi:hypothetical protein
MPHNPTTDDGEQHKEVYARFGLAAYWAQCIETSLNLFYLMYPRVNNPTLTVATLDSMEASRRKQTLGQLINDFRKYVELDAGSEQLLRNALDKRNFLMHRYFEDRADYFMSKGGRTQMIEELTEIAVDLQIADKLIGVVYRCLQHELGITDEAIDREFADRQAAAALSDHSA